MLIIFYTTFQDINAEYDAFKKDIAVATFYFVKATALGELVHFFFLIFNSLSGIRAVCPDDLP